MPPIQQQPEAPNLSDLFQILKRRKWSLILPFLVILLLAATVALILPSIYQSTSTILIEEQEVPAEFVKAAVTSYAEQRMETIKQRIMSFQRLNELVDKFNLYPDLREDWTKEQIIEKMRKDIQIDPVSADVTDPKTGRPGTATIAFTLSYQGKNPTVVQQVTNALTSFFLEENLQVRTRQAKETTQFLEDEMKGLKDHLTKLDSSISAFKQEHINELPELLQTNLEARERMDRNIDQLNDQIRTLKEREGYLETQLAAISPSGDEKRKRLEELKIQLVNLKTKFSDEHPDVVKTRREIADLEKQMVVSRSKGAKEARAGQDQSDNPAYVTLASQLASTRYDMASLSRQIDDLRKKEAEYRRRVENTPKVENAYKVLLVDRDNTQAKYNDLMSKFMEARVALGLEKEQKGERFTLIDPPRFPDKPVKPNRLAILLIGFVLATGGGVGFAALREYSDQSVRDIRRLSMATPFPVLAAIPEIETRHDIAVKRLKRAFASAAVVVLVAGVVVAFNFLVMDLDVFWAKLMMKFSHLFA
jgi:succinoglycan biosynthesis transport protein ExoP